MAQCYACSKEIPYGAMMKSLYGKYLRRNIVRRTLCVFDCPHCGAVCQETARSYYLFVAIFVGSVVGIALWLQQRSLLTEVRWQYVVGVVALFVVHNYLWWRTAAQLKEPYVFWWEDR